MIDISKIRSNSDSVTKALSKRGIDVSFTELLEWDNERRKLVVKSDTLRNQRNYVSRKISETKKTGLLSQELINEMREVGQQIKQLDNESNSLSVRIQQFLEQLPNIPDSDVTHGGKENNAVIRISGDQPVFKFPLNDHVSIATKLGMIDYERGVKISGSGFWLYRGYGALLEMALINYCINRNVTAGYEFMLLPHIVNWDCGYISGQFPKFGLDVYRVSEDVDIPSEERDSQILIPTSETALAAIHRNEIIDPSTLPRKYCAFTPCYRREAGSYRTHDRGTIRGHQFHKVEMFQFVIPEESDATLQEMVQHAESLVADLGLHYRVSQLAAADCSAASAKTYDIEVWIPSMNSYEEVSSASNTRDYQSRRAHTRVRTASGTRLLHTLNASGLATSRLLPAIIETYQQKDGSIIIPEVLQPFTGTNIISSSNSS